MPTPLMTGKSILLKLTEDNFLLRQMELLPLFNNCGLDHILEEEALMVSVINEIRALVPNPI